MEPFTTAELTEIDNITNPNQIKNAILDTILRGLNGDETTARTRKLLLKISQIVNIFGHFNSEFRTEATAAGIDMDEEFTKLKITTNIKRLTDGVVQPPAVRLKIITDMFDRLILSECLKKAAKNAKVPVALLVFGGIGFYIYEVEKHSPNPYNS